MDPVPDLELPVVLLSHRGPVTFSSGPDGRTATRGGGGLVTALTGLAGHLDDAVWVCGASSDEDREVAREAGKSAVPVEMGVEPRLLEPGEAAEAPTIGVRFVEVDAQQHDDFYAVIANPLLWFLQHQLYGLADEPDLTSYEHAAFEDGYVAVNEHFADAVAAEVDARGGRAVVMLHDYHFYLVADRVRERCPDVLLSHFVHIPWPGPDAWRMLPPDMRERLLVGLLGNDVVAFHTERFARNFLLCAQELLGLAVDMDRMTLRVGARTVQARVYPISIDVDAITATADSAASRAHRAALQDLVGGGSLLLRVDRTDPSKNIVRGFRAYDQLLTDHPELAGQVTFLALLQPSRQDVPEYSDYLARIGAVVAEVNARHGRDGWHPIDLRLQNDMPLAAAAYALFDVLMVNAVADGMNLVAKEAVVVNERDGVLALSENTGAHDELGAFAVTLFPFDVQQQADALYAALTMPRAERAARREAAADVVRHNDVARWLARQLSDLSALRISRR